MASILKTICTLVVLLALFIVLVSASHSPSLTPFAAGTRTETAHAAGDPPAVPMRIMQQSMHDLGSTIESIGAARSTLLQKAAQDPHDLESLEAASQAYRDSHLAPAEHDRRATRRNRLGAGRSTGWDDDESNHDGQQAGDDCGDLR